MNILYLTNHLNTGGISSYLLTLARGMKKNGHEVYVASGEGELIARFKEEGITHIPAPLKTKAEISPNVLAGFFQLLPELKKKNIDLIHANTRVTQILASLLAGFSRKPFISTAHGFFKTKLIRKIFPCWGKRVIAISEQVRDSLMHDFGIKDSYIRVIHNGIDLEKFNSRFTADGPGLKTGFGLKINGPVVGIVARLSEVKGHSYLIMAMKIVLEKFPEAQLVIAGEGKIKDSLVELSRQLWIDKSIFFIPNVSDTREIISIMDIFVLPSLEEGLGLSLMEAMSMGKAVVGSDIGGIRTLIQHQDNGLLVKKAHVEQLSAAIIELIADAQKRKILGERAARFIAHNFSQEKMVAETEKLYLECVNEKL